MENNDNLEFTEGKTTNKSDENPTVEIVTEPRIHEGSPSVKQFTDKESPKRVLRKLFPKQRWPISGGWGYSQNDAVVIELDDEGDGVHFEYVFMECRSLAEAHNSLPEGKYLVGLDLETKKQQLIFGEDGRSYDKITMKVKAYLNDYPRFMGLSHPKEYEYEVVGWFDITRFFGN